MPKQMIARAVMTGMLLGAFALGYVAGSANHQRADAQGLDGILDQAGKAGAPLGSVSQLCSSIVEMQDHVTGLQEPRDPPESAVSPDAPPARPSPR